MVMDRTFLGFYVKGNFEAQKEMVGDRTVQEAVDNIRDFHKDQFNGWELRTLNLICCMRINDPPYHKYEQREPL